MPEIRCTQLFKDGVKIGEENCVEVSDGELVAEAKARRRENVFDELDSLHQDIAAIKDRLGITEQSPLP